MKVTKHFPKKLLTFFLLMCMVTALVGCNEEESSGTRKGAEREKRVEKTTPSPSTEIIPTFTPTETPTPTMSVAQKLFMPYCDVWKQYIVEIEDSTFTDEEMHFSEFLVIEPDFTASLYYNYKQPNELLAAADMKVEINDYDNYLYQFEYLQSDDIPYTYHILGLDNNGFLEVSCYFYYDDGTLMTSHEYYIRVSE